MSCYQIPHDRYTIVVGWINDLETFFLRVTERGGAGQRDIDHLWVGAEPRALLSVEAVRHYLRPYHIALPRTLAGQLQRDLERRTPPTVLGRRRQRLWRGR